MTKEHQELVRQLQAIDRLVDSARPRRHAQWSALFNLLAVFCEDDSSPRSNRALVQLVRGWLEDCGRELPEAGLHRRIQSLVRALGAFADAPPPDADNPTPAALSVDRDTLQLVARLRHELGLSLLYIHRHLTEHLQRSISYEDLVVAIHRATTSSHASVATA
jgi:hypothetical protein